MHNEFEMVVLFWDVVILLMYKSLGKKEIVNKHHQSWLCPFKFRSLLFGRPVNILSQLKICILSFVYLEFNFLVEPVLKIIPLTPLRFDWVLFLGFIRRVIYQFPNVCPFDYM